MKAESSSRIRSNDSRKVRVVIMRSISRCKVIKKNIARGKNILNANERGRGNSLRFICD